MSTRTLAVDYGDRKLDIDVPASAVVAEFQDPEFLADPDAAVRAALARPRGLPPLAETARTAAAGSARNSGSWNSATTAEAGTSMSSLRSP